VAPAAKLTPLQTTLPVKRAWLSVAAVELARQTAHLPTSLVHDKVLWVDGGGTVHALAARSGRRLWQYDTGGAASSGVGAGIANRVFVGTRNAEVLALDENTGTLHWRASVSSEIVAPPMGARGIVVAHTVDGQIYGLAAEDGRVVWRFESSVPPLSLRGTSIPVIDDDRVLAGLANGKLVALSLFDGSLRWRAELATPSGRSELERMVDVDATPRVIGDVVFAAAFQARLSALAAATGRLLWARDVSIFQDLAVDDERIYATDADGQLWCYFQRNGTVAWRQDALKGRNVTGPALYRDYLVVGDHEGYVHWLRREDGQVVHRERLDDHPITAAPVVGNDRVYLATPSGVVIAMGLP
jgi:outer membrane protein assembly factor BamB